MTPLSADPPSSPPQHAWAGRAPSVVRFLVASGEAARTQDERKGLSQEELGFEADLDRTYVSGVERGVRNPTVVTIRRLAAALGVAPSRLMRAAEAEG